MLKNLLGKVIRGSATKMVIVVRTDVKMGRGKIAAQVAHAAVALYQTSLKSSNPHLEPWLRQGQPKVVLRTDFDCRETLNKIYESAIAHNLTTCIIRDAGRTQVETGTVTVVGVGPNKIEDVDKVTAGFKLL